MILAPSMCSAVVHTTGGTQDGNNHFGGTFGFFTNVVGSGSSGRGGSSVKKCAVIGQVVVPGEVRVVSHGERKSWHRLRILHRAQLENISTERVKGCWARARVTGHTWRGSDRIQLEM